MSKQFHSWYNGIKLGSFSTVDEAKECIYQHPNYKKSKFTKKGDARSNNENRDEYFRIYDSDGAGWYIK
jgi:hypothetical protein